MTIVIIDELVPLLVMESFTIYMDGPRGVFLLCHRCGYCSVEETRNDLNLGRRLYDCLRNRCSR